MHCSKRFFEPGEHDVVIRVSKAAERSRRHNTDAFPKSASTRRSLKTRKNAVSVLWSFRLCYIKFDKTVSILTRPYFNPFVTYNVCWREDKEKANGSKDGYRREAKGPIMVIHVCDEAKNLKKDFHCPRDLLVQEMKYFAEYLSTDAQRWEEVDISVHCDVQIFDWLIKYVKRGSKEVQEEPKLVKKDFHCPRDLLVQEMKYFAEYLSTDAQRWEEVDISVHCDVQIFDWLIKYVKRGSKEVQEEPKLECIKFCHKNMSTIVSTPCNMGCINDRLLTRIADLFNHNEADEVKDRKDKFKSKLFSKKIEKLFEPEGVNPDSPEKATSLFRCSVCKRLLTHSLQSKVKCMPCRMTIDRNGKMTYSHVRDPKFDVNDYILELKTQLKTWRDVYWRLWGTINSLTCSRCGEVFPLTEFGHCSYHPEMARYDNEPGSATSCVGVHPCCHQSALRFDPALIIKGCRVKDHIISLPDPPSPVVSGGGGTGEGDGGSNERSVAGSKPPKSPTQKVYDDLLLRRDVICVPYQRLSDLSDMKIEVFQNEVYACHTHNSGLHLPSLSTAGAVEGKTESRPRLQALTVEKEVSYYLDDVGFGESDEETGDEEGPKDANSNKRAGKGLKKSRVTVEPQAILLGAPGFEQTKKSTWDTQRSMRYNQDAQRQEDARRMKEIRLFLTRLRLNLDKVDNRPKREVAGGLFCKLESQWRTNNIQVQGRQQQAYSFSIFNSMNKEKKKRKKKEKKKKKKKKKNNNNNCLYRRP
ncbi:hypothetical protein ElyMa_000037800 [Elysia marginata]|uniref:SANT and BTB domain-containing protein n=1 Tax=Elysia marginata TaxID=1093978 RepID=A0AAV4EEA3_9GAST|nr:hypothetical protein ElyMa_000037800 [Elysia marginata]